jgi:hypothetical protein
MNIVTGTTGADPSFSFLQAITPKGIPASTPR